MGKDQGKACRGDILVGVCYRLPNQDEEKDKAFCEQLAEVAQLPALILIGDFNFSDICWKYNTAQRKQSKRFLECVEDSLRSLRSWCESLPGWCPDKPALH